MQTEPPRWQPREGSFHPNVYPPITLKFFLQSPWHLLSWHLIKFPCLNYSDVQVRVIPNKRTYNSNSEGASVQSDRRSQGVSDPEGCRPVSAHPAELSTGSLVVPAASVSRSAGTWASRGSQGWGKTLRGPHPGPRTQVSAAGTVGSGILGFQDHSSSTWDPAETRDICRFPCLYKHGNPGYLYPPWLAMPLVGSTR